MSELLSVTNLTKKFGGRAVLSEVSFNVRPGEILGLIGPNGAGKTTLFECLAGLLPCNSGNLVFRDNRLRSNQLNRALFYVPDSIVPWSEQTVSWILEFFRKLYRQRQTKLDSLIEPLRLAEIRSARLATLSKGERKRLLLSLGLFTSQPLLLLDEPFDGLDLRQTKQAMSVLKTEAGSSRTLVLSIHQLIDAERVCDRFVLLNNGKCVAQGTMDELRDQTGLAQAGLEEVFLALT